MKIADHFKLHYFPNGYLEAACFFLSNEKTKHCIVVDAGENASNVEKELTRLGLTPVLLLHTHGHFDHAGESALLKQKFKIPLWIHQGDEGLYTHLREQGAMFGRRLPPAEKIDHFIVDGEIIELDGEAVFKTIHTPGHTQGGCCFYFENQNGPQLISGDTLFRECVGRTDLPGGDSEAIVKSVREKLFILPEETVVYPGHEMTTTIGHEIKFNPLV